MTVSKEQLDIALEKWASARHIAISAEIAWANVMKSYDALIASLRAHGHTWAQAKDEFDRLSDTHRDTLMKAWQEMDRLCGEYQILLDEFNTKGK